MRNRRERTLQDICDVTPTLSQPQITPVLRGNVRMQGPSDEANCDSLTNMVTSDNSSHCSSRSLKDYQGKSRTCNVCSAPCSSCFHVNKALLKSNNEHGGETCAGNTETGQLSILSTVGGMDSTADSFSENAAGKASSRTSNASDGRRSPEGHDDCLSCVSGTDEQLNRKSDTEDSGNKCNKQNGGEIFRKMSPSSSQTGTYSQNSGTVGIYLTKNTDDANHATDIQKVRNTSEASNDKNLPHEENPVNVKDDRPSDTKVEPLKGSTGHLNSSSPNGVASDDVCGDAPKMDVNPTEKNDDMEIDPHPADESDDSDMVEQDVKVCDICGDAGREDLLAICSRCSDGAEHTYCMRVMLKKLPEGEWLCEECQTLELVGKGKQEKIGSVDENEKNNSSGRVSENLNNSDVEGRRTKSSTKYPSKRLRDDEDAEVSSTAKKLALETTIGSPKTSNSKPAVLSRMSSLKNLDKGRPRSPNRSTLDTIPVNDVTELAKPSLDARGLNLRGNFSKSNSFHSLNSKPKTKLVDQVIIQRQKSAKEHGSFRLKEDVVRSISKSMSFRSTNSNRSESKIKMLSPRSSNIHDVKNTKERSAFERQHSFRTEHPSNNSVMGASMSSTSRIDRRPSFRAESSSLASPTNQQEVKPVQTDGRSTALSRSFSLASRRNADLPSTTGEFKRPSKHGHSIPVVSSANGANNTEQKYNHTSLKQDPGSCGVSEKLSISASEGVSDGLVQSKDLANSADRPREYSGSRLGPPSVKSSRDESDNLKAAIEAAVLRKPGVYRKNRASGQSDQSSAPTLAPVASHIDHMLSAKSRKLSSDAELAEWPSASRKFTSDPLKEETLNSVKQSLLVRPEGALSGVRDGVHVGISSRDALSNVPAVMPLLLKSIATPEHEYIWQGSFEICRSGQTFELWDGIQAHLSTCASPKVVEAVNKFNNRITLSEVPRASTWPAQFQKSGVGDDNIALFFFAQDLQSHEKIYKVLLDNMMKNDLALKGNINGVELLIFPSNQLPVNLQRWNMFFFLWGVFRGKKEPSPRQMPESTIAPRHIPPPIMSLPENRCSLKPISDNTSQDGPSPRQMPESTIAPRLIPPPIMSLPENRCSLKPISENASQDGPSPRQMPESTIAPRHIPPPIMSLPENRCSLTPISDNGSQEGQPGLKVPPSEELQGVPRVVKRGVCMDISSLDQLGHGLNSSSSSTAKGDGPEQCGWGSYQESGITSGCCPPVAVTGPDAGRDQPLLKPKTQLDNPYSLHDSCKSVASTPKITCEGVILEKTCHQDELKLRMDAIDLSRDAELPMEDGMCIKDLNVEPDKWLFSHKEPMLPGPSSSGNHNLSAGFGCVSPGNDIMHNETVRTLEKVNHVPTVSYTLQSQHGESDLGSIPTYYEHGHGEKFFFPVQLQPPNPWKTHLLDDDGLSDKAPNLELALGAERKPQSLGIEPLFVTSKIEHKVHEERILKKAEEDVSASLSLSLSFPFPEKEVDAKSEQQLLSQRKHVNSSSRLLFGKLRDN
ncbi:dentin sialophosphoprotein-like isoform X1 [Salvia divinorum]|uniref:Dentin sialophosphoprotein-like isoform X1 n=1 Tax=Salvia divinorum TaxID=28513 RepID=A0ABD1H324_SALDI